jgi:hypothetical protein
MSFTPIRQPSLPASSSLNTRLPGSDTAVERPLVENLRSFDPDTLNLTWSNNRWVLSSGNAVLKDFGRKESEGRQALRLARALRLNQYGTVGAPAPAMEYWLTDGRAPTGIVPGLQVVNFDSASLHIEETLGQWCLRDARRVLFNFGSKADDARQALAVLRKYGFEQVAVVGQMAPSMFVFLANTAGTAPAARPVRSPADHDPPEVTARKAEELKRLKERMPGLDAETVAQPTLRPLRTPDQPRQPFTSTMREFSGDALNAADRPRGVGAADPGDRVPFDWRQVQVRLEGNEWKLASGGLVLANFGADQDAARRALDVVRYYHFTEQRLIGGPARRFSFYLINGLAPHGLPFGIASEPFDPEAVHVQQSNGQWALVAGDRPLVVLGDQRDEATDLLAAIQRQHFDHLCRVGRPEAGFTFLVRTR